MVSITESLKQYQYHLVPTGPVIPHSEFLAQPMPDYGTLKHNLDCQEQPCAVLWKLSQKIAD